MSYKNDTDFDIGTEKNIYFKNFDARGYTVIFRGPSGKIRYLKVIPCLSKPLGVLNF